MPLSNYFIDPAGGSDSGDGTIVDPWQTELPFISSVTRNTNDGDRINIKAGAPLILSAPIDIQTNYNKGTSGPPLMFQGYTETQGDGGVGEIDGDGTHTIIDTLGQQHDVWFADLKMGNCGASPVINKGNGDRWNFVGCEIHGTDSNAVNVRSQIQFLRCRFSNIAGFGVSPGTLSNIGLCRFENGPTRKFTNAVQMTAPNTLQALTNCLFVLDGDSNGILLQNFHKRIYGNIIWSDGGAGSGIVTTVSTVTYSAMIERNVIAGFSGSGGRGIDWGGVNRLNGVYQRNAFFNNATHEVGTGNNLISRNNHILTADPFVDAANGKFNLNNEVGGGKVVREILTQL